MAFRGEREFLINEIAQLQHEQLNTHQEARQQSWTREQSSLAFDTRLARLAALMRELTKLDEGGRVP